MNTKPEVKEVIKTIIIAAILILLTYWLLPLVPGLPAIVLTITILAIVILAIWHILSVLGWW